MKKKQAILAVLVALTLTGCQKPKETPVSAPAALAIETITVKKGDIRNQYSYSGKVKPIEEANVMAMTTGKVASVNVDVGSVVNAGSVLFQMDTADLQNNLNSLNASLSVADANVKSAQTGVNIANGASMQSQIEAAKAALTNAELGVSSAQMAYDNAKTAYDNNTQLYAAGIISKSDMDNIQLNYDNAKINLDKALEGQSQASESYNIIAGKMPQENAQRAQDALNIAVASRGATASQIASTQKALRDATVTSPISGVVTAKNIVPGTLISQSQPAIVVSDMRQVEVQVGVSEQVINTINVGESVSVKIQTISDQAFNGTISSINPSASQSGTFDVKILLDNSNGQLKAGMVAEVYFTKEFAPSTIVVPRSTVITKDDESYVYIVEQDAAVKVPVTTGIDTGESIEVLTGLNEGAKLISKGQTFVADGDPVNVIAEDGIDIKKPIDTTTEPEESSNSKDTAAKKGE